MMELTVDRDCCVLDASGKLTRDDFDRIVPELEHQLAGVAGKQLLIRLHDFEGWSPGAMLEDLKFDLRHRHDFDRVAVVGSRSFERIGTELGRLLFDADMRFFRHEERARSWLSQPRTSNGMPLGAKVLSFMFVSAGASKLLGVRMMKTSFAKWGYPPSLMYAVGLAEVAAGLGLLLPSTRRPAALGLSALMGGAIATHIACEETPMALPAAATLAGAAALARGESP